MGRRRQLPDTSYNMTSNHSKSSQLRALLTSPQLEFILEAHNGISAKLAQQAGFRGIWASGLALSAQFCVRDSNEASWTQVVDMLEFMSDATDIPILLDGDTGYGNFNNMRRLVRKLEQRGIAGVCIEDKQFPKTNSFIHGERQALADIDEFCGKIKAGKDSQSDQDFCIVARVEALIAGRSMQEALDRAHAYTGAGADAILIHSRRSRPDEIVAFAERWDGSCPLVIVPTKYYSAPVEVFKKAGISLVIWANQMIRAAVRAMEKTSKQIYEQESLTGVEDRIAAVDSLFDLQGADELLRAQERYLKKARQCNALVLAASRGNNLYELTVDKPKAMLKIGGKPLLQRLVDEFRKQDISDITVVAGYQAQAFNLSGIQLCMNELHEQTNELYSLTCARDRFSDDMLIMYGDLLFRSYVLRDLLEASGEIVIVVDSLAAEPESGGTPDYVWCDRPDDRSMFMQEVFMLRMAESRQAGQGAPSGRWTGMARFRRQGSKWLTTALDELTKRDDFGALNLPDLLNYLTGQGHPVTVHYINGHWLDVNSVHDLERAGDFAAD